ncbi:hypothetical protein [Fusobacterium russii]|uniref:hypothetical protein n=1 Tax=Fusobacterium russii TaxID=854 RepID=UPI0003A82015|nr:hypothetical protein [Fusobacterium russii]
MSKLKIKLFNFSLIPVLLLAGLFFVSIARSDNSDINYAKEMINNIKHLRTSIDKYYLQTGEFPNLAGEGVNENLELIEYRSKEGDKVNFKDIYGASILVGTPDFKDLSASNKVYDVQNFKEVTNNGGWNYNIKTGEVHINLPDNFFDQSINWNSF